MRLIEKFNQTEVSLVISDYPQKSVCGEKNYGITWYTKETLEVLAQNYHEHFVVLAEKGRGKGFELAAGGKILVLRIFDQKTPTLFPRILRWLLTFSKVKNVYVHSEFCTNGGVKNFILLLPFLLLIKLCQKRITFFAHNVVLCFDSLAPHLNFKKGTLTLKFLNLGLSLYYQALGMMVNRIVVMDEVMRKRLRRFVAERKILLVPIWARERRYRGNRQAVQRELGIGRDDFVLLYFGFVTWYKGADWIIRNLSQISKIKNKKIKLILAGGEAYSLKDKKYYQKFYQSQVRKAKKCPQIIFTGFVPEREIPKYFAASDLVVFPYRGYIGSSGVLSLALSFRKPFILSQKMAEILENKDFAFQLKESKLEPWEIMFSFNHASFERILKRVQDPRFYQKLRLFSQKLGKSRSIKRVLPFYWEQVLR